MYNLISLVGFILAILISFLLNKCKNSMVILRVVSGCVFAYKSIHYIYQNINGTFSIPVEISTITYFLMPIILVFNIKKLFGVGSFFGIIAGLGYFFCYIILGFMLEDKIILKDLFLGCFNHGYLLVSGVYLFKTNKLLDIDKLKIWLTMFAMLSWALVFYDIEMRGITFIYYIIKPQFLFVFENLSLNVLLMIFYYFCLVTFFYFAIQIFFHFNRKKQTNFNYAEAVCENKN